MTAKSILAILNLLMKKYLKNKKILAAGGVVVLIVIIAAAGFFVLSSRNKPANFSNPGDGQSSQDQPVATLTAKDIGLVVTVRPDNRAMMFQMSSL